MRELQPCSVGCCRVTVEAAMKREPESTASFNYGTGAIPSNEALAFGSHFASLLIGIPDTFGNATNTTIPYLDHTGTISLYL